MNVYDIFRILYGATVVAGAVIGVAAFIMASRTSSWSAPPVRPFTSLLFFVIPFTAFCRLLSKPLEQQGAFELWGQVALIIVWLAASAKAAFRSMALKDRGEKSPNQTMQPTASPRTASLSDD